MHQCNRETITTSASFRSLVLWAVVGGMLGAAGCGSKGSESEAPAAEAPTGQVAGKVETKPAAETSEAKAEGQDNAAEAKANAEAAEDQAKGADPKAEGDKAADKPEAGEKDEQAKAVDAKLREFFDLLQANKMDEARGLMIEPGLCKELWEDAKVCEQVNAGQEEGYQTFVKDPIPKGSTIVNLVVGNRQVLGADRGLKVEVGIWVGSLIHAKSSTGHEYSIRSLGVLETPKGLRVLWGRRRSGPDSIRNPEKNAPEGGPIAPKPSGTATPDGDAEKKGDAKAKTKDPQGAVAVPAKAPTAAGAEAAPAATKTAPSKAAPSKAAPTKAAAEKAKAAGGESSK